MSHRQPLVAVLTAVDSVAVAAEAVAAGAAMVDAVTDEALVANIKEAGLDVLVCGPGPVADLTRYTLAEAQEAARRGVPRERIVAEVSLDQLQAARGDGWLTLVDVDADPGVTASDHEASAREASARAGAIATVSAWLGANVIATNHVREICRCLDMTESIRGTRPPAWAVRGLG